MKLLRKLLFEQSGNISLIVAGGMVVFLGFLGTVIDFGQVYIQKQRLYNAYDAGALAGIQLILHGEPITEETARQYVEKNGAVATVIHADSTAKTVQVSGSKDVPLSFAELLGFRTAHVQASVTAQAGTLVGGRGIVPIAVPDQEFVYGKSYVLSDGAGNGQSGNFGFLDFSGRGAASLEEDITYGYNGLVRVGDEIYTKTGVNKGVVERAISLRIHEDDADEHCRSEENGNTADTEGDRNCARMMILPVVDTLDVNGKKPVHVVGFAAFFLERLEGEGGHQSIIGRFVRTVYPGEMGSGPNYGVFSVKLIH